MSIARLFPLMGPLLILASIGSTPCIAGAPVLTVDAYKLEAQKRISLSTYEYTYRVTTLNGGGEARGVAATLKGVPPMLTIIDGSLSFGTVAANTKKPSTDTFKIRYDRTKGSFTSADLVWKFDYDDPSLGLLVAPPGTPAAQAATDFHDQRVELTAGELEVAPNGAPVVRTEVLIAFNASATVDDVNNLLNAYNARIIGMLSGRSIFVVRIPDPGSVAQLDATIVAMQAMPGVDSVTASVQPGITRLPRNAAFQLDPPTRLDAIAHHLAIRSNGAWNASRLFEKNAAAGKLPEIVIVDYFGSGHLTAGSDWNLTTQAADFGTEQTADFSLPENDKHRGHGYDVLSIIGASFGGGNTDEGLVTGISPVRLKVKAVDLHKYGVWNAFQQAVDYIRAASLDGNRRLILNTSLGHHGSGCTTRVEVVGNVPIIVTDCPEVTPEKELELAGDSENWLQWLRGDDYLEFQPGSLEHRFLHLSAAGNNYKIAATDAFFANRAAKANNPARYRSTGNIVLDPRGNPRLIPPLLNLLAVEGRVGLFSAPSTPNPTPRARPTPICNNNISRPIDPNWRPFSPGGDLSGIGTLIDVDNGQIPGILTPLSGTGDRRKVGSSFAAPQAAGVAALIFAARPELSLAQVKRILTRTTGGYAPELCPPNEGDYHAPLDAYAAVLAADNPDFDTNHNLGVAATAENAPVRLAILDVAKGADAAHLLPEPDDQFTQADILKFLEEFQKRRGTKLDFSRYDLNGDGRTGEPWVLRDPAHPVSVTTAQGSTRFDLNGDGLFNSVVKTVEGVDVVLDENKVTDLAVLVYYAYSPLYVGSEYERTLMLLPYLEWMNASDRTKPFLRSLRLDLSSVVPDFTGDTVLSNIAYQSANDTGARFGTQFISQCGQERGGVPTYSQTVLNQNTAPAADDVVSPTWWWAMADTNLPPRGQVARRPCSDFIAALPGTGRMLINITKFRTGETEREYQTRIDLGSPDLTAPRAGSFQPGPNRLATQTAVHGYADSGNIGSFFGGPPSNRFRLKSVGLLGATIYSYGERN